MLGYTVSGTIEEWKLITLTGVRNGDDVQVTATPAGGRVDGHTKTAISTTPGEIELYGWLNPSQPLSENVAAGDELSSAGGGLARVRRVADQRAAIALSAGVSGGACLTLGRPSSALVGMRKYTVLGSSSGPTRSTTSFATIADMTKTFTSGGFPTLIKASIAADVHDGDSWELALFNDGTEIAGSNFLVKFTSASGALVVAGSIGGLIATTYALVDLAAGSRVITVGWKPVTGTARAIGTKRRLDVIELGMAIG